MAAPTFAEELKAHRSPVSLTLSFESRLTTELTQPTSRRLDTPGANVAVATLVTLKDVVATVRTQEARIGADRNLSDKGKVDTRVAVAVPVIKQVAFVQKAFTDAQNAEARLRHLLLDPITQRPAGDPVVIFLREKEIRDSIRSLDVNQSTAFFLRALEKDDLETTRALLDSPGPALVAADIRARGEESYARRTNRAAFEKQQALTYLIEYLQSLVVHCAQWLVSLDASAEDVAKALRPMEEA